MCFYMPAEVHEALERSVEVLRQLEVFDDITALIDSQPVVGCYNSCYDRFFHMHHNLV
jgi:hypothetical protein